MITNSEQFHFRQLVGLDACTRCGECQKWCETYTGERLTAPQQKLKTFRSWLKGERLPPFLSRLLGGVKPEEPECREFSTALFSCTLCSRCAAVCPVKIDLPGIWLQLREQMVRGGIYPKGLDQAKAAIATEHNVLAYPNEERATWVEFMTQAPGDCFQRTKAEVVYFVGCMSSFSPAVQSIPEAFVQLLTRTGVEFTILGEQEWCCGFPLIAAGMREAAEELKRHNIEKMREKGAKKVVFTCPSCYKTWKQEYHSSLAGIELFHSTQFIDLLIREGKIRFHQMENKATYHDPCDLGRNSGVYLSPRRVITAIPGLSFVEIAQNKDRGYCCGGGGDLEISNPQLTSAVAGRTLAVIRDTRADLLVTACQQCKRVLVKAVEEHQARIEVLDIAELAWKAIAA